MAPEEKPPGDLRLLSRQIGVGIARLERRVKELKGFDISQANTSHNPGIRALSAAIEETLVSIFGLSTPAYIRYYAAVSLYRKQIKFRGVPTNFRMSYQEGIENSIALLEQAKDSLQEGLEFSEVSEEDRALRAFEGLELHPEIELASGDLYRDGHYVNAIEDAVKALNTLVRLRSGVDDLDGSTLMEHVFSPNNPILKFNDLTNRSDKDEQKGFMMLFSGAVAGLRNPRAHKIIEDDPERAVEFIAFVSLLAKLLDEAKKATLKNENFKRSLMLDIRAAN
jgi:uncharacterized protein (TIGR02391 family)